MFKRHSDEDLSLPANDWTSGLASGPAMPGFLSLRRILQRDLPDPEGLSEARVISTLNAVELELLEHGIKVDFLDTLPARVAYRGILQMLDTPIEAASSPYAVTHLDGCDSACESCFQLAHCSVAREILGSEWRAAVDQAGINPSWSALFAAEEED
ncbi:MAG: hypothetical protein JF616_14580 [Fibrobacteres bacterium]|jgi:hypothetical protein|nr:hypothetical protein [Fibrobacterota bacterium]